MKLDGYFMKQGIKVLETSMKKHIKAGFYTEALKL
jgi:hypothetical protein